MRLWWMVAVMLGPKYFVRVLVFSLLGGAFLVYCVAGR